MLLSFLSLILVGHICLDHSKDLDGRDLKEEHKDLEHCHNCGKEIRWSKREVNFNYWGDEECYCEKCWYDLDLYILDREGNDAWIDSETRAVLYAD